MTDDIRPPSIRRGQLKELATKAKIRNKNRYGVESFINYLSALDNSQTDIPLKDEESQKASLLSQMDMLDAMFTYLSLHGDYKIEAPQAYMSALRAQRQFCNTLMMLKKLSHSSAPPTAAK